MNDLFIILTASLVAINAAILGVFLVLRKMSLIGDAISHAVLPGIVVAYLFSGDRTSPLLLLAAAFTGVLTAVMIEWLSKKVKIQSDAAIGITYTLLFALGMIMISGWFKGNVDIDLDCVLYGDIALINLDKIIIDQNLYLGPRALYIELAAAIVVITITAIGFKGFKLLSFNRDYGISLGIKMGNWHFLMMAMVSLVTVVSFEVVGAVLVIGFLIIPAATAQLLTHKLGNMLALSIFFGVIAVVIGYYAAVWMNVSITGAMISVSGLLFFIVMLFVVIKSKQV
ncbi:metal ABC transporter permease [Paracrocinitomix mangrovi]|uniref:metal ABC transporter permease n=1 Tax=Paracrocinitomix mangrovi TaxID=2862509 RepID=UPI001C8ECD55|nr:metal ABC transporter permease [Paracrocinitomix mangrovi]UKN02888.1 metal ABC transporter permease [Paracrocinitomix mangrovi]